MRSSRPAVLLAALCFALATLALGSVAGAQTYPGTPTITLSKTTVPQGGTLTVTCTGFMPDGQVKITLQEPPVDLGTVTVDGEGNLVKDITLPPGTTVGPHTVSCTGPGDDGQIVTVTAELIVTGTTPTTTNPGSLPRTGTDSTTLLRIGIVLIVAGAALAVVFRRRKSESTNA